MAGINDNAPCFPTTELITVATEDSAPNANPPVSPSSEASSRSVEGEPICRICLDRGTETLVSPCKCAGSTEFAHESCLLKWFFKTRRRRCELCLSEVNVKSVGFKPLQKWRLPMESCDFVFYLFTLYCVIMIVFTALIVWIATQCCLSPVCITLYVVCGMSLLYFIYCCGCVEYSKTYWKACVTTNKNWRIYNREESSRTKFKAAKDKVSGCGPDNSRTSEPCTEQCAVSIPLEGAAGESTLHPNGDRIMSSSSLSGSTTLIHCFQQADTTSQAEAMSPRISSPLCSSPSSFSPLAFGRELEYTGSISLLQDVACFSQNETHNGGKTRKIDVHINPSNADADDNRRDKIHDVKDDRSKECVVKMGGDGVTNKGFDDTKL